MIDDADEKLLRELGALVRSGERAGDDALLERLARGELSEPELAALRQRAAHEPELERALAAHAPIASADRARLTTRLVEAARARVEQGSVQWRQRLRRPAWVLLPLSAAAGALLWLGQPEPLGPLPSYALQVEGGQAEVRSTPAGVDPQAELSPPISVGRDTRLRLLLRPDTRVDGELTAQAFMNAAALQIAWPLQITRADSGALQLRLAPPPAPIATGAELHVVVGRPRLLSARAPALAHGPSTRGTGYQHWRIAIVAGR